MGAKTWMLAYVDGKAAEILKSGPVLDRPASAKLAQELFPSAQLQPAEDGDLSYTNPPDDEVHVGCFPGLSIVAAAEFALDYPSQLPQSFLDHARGRTVYLHAMHSVVDWFAFAIWEKGELVRALSLSPDSGVLEDIGPKRPFEESFWSGERPVGDEDEDEDDEYPLPFHPLELGEEALLAMFGYQLEGFVDENQVQPEEIPLLTFKRSVKRWWRFW